MAPPILPDISVTLVYGDGKFIKPLIDTTTGLTFSLESHDDAKSIVNVYSNGAIYYRSINNYLGVDEVKLRATNASGEFTVATYTFTIQSFLHDNVYTQTTGQLTGLLTPSAPQLTQGVVAYSKLTDPQHGVAIVNTDGSYTYTPTTGYTGHDSFSVSATYGGTTLNVIINVIIGTPAVQTQDINIYFADNYTTTGDFYNVNGNYIYTLEDYRGLNTVTINPNGTYSIYARNPTITGSSDIIYVRATNTTGDYSIFKVLATMAGEGEAVLNDVYITTTAVYNGQLVAQYNDQQQSLASSYSKLTDPQHGVAIVNTDGSYTYTPTVGYTGNDSFTVSVTVTYNGQYPQTTNATVFVTVTTSLTFNDVEITTPMNTQFTGQFAADDSSATYSKLTDPQHGVAIVNTDGSYTYTPTTGYTGNDSFSVNATVGSASATANVTITILQAKEPTDTIVVISRNVKIDGNDVTSNVTKCTVVRELGKPYNTMRLELGNYNLNKDLIRNKDKRVIVTIGTDIYSFIIIDADTDARSNVTILGKTQGCLLDEPFKASGKLNLVGDASTVISNICTGIVYSNTTANFSFGKGSFEFTGVAQQGLERILQVSGAAMYDKEGIINMEPAFRIPQDAQPEIIINNNILTDKEIVEDLSGSPLVNTIVFNSSTNNIYSEPKITMAIPNLGNPYFYFNPVPTHINQIRHNLGATDLSDKIINYEGLLKEERVVYVDGGITEVLSVKVNGFDVPYNVEIGHNVLVLDASATGTVKVSYKTKAILNYTVNGLYNSTEKTRTYKLRYLNQALDEAIPVVEISPDAPTDNTPEHNESGDICIVDVDQNVSKSAEFKFRVSPGKLANIVFVADPSAATVIYSTTPIPISLAGTNASASSALLGGISKVTKTMPTTTSATIADLVGDGNHYGFYLPSGITPTGFKVGSQSIPFTQGDPNVSGVTDYYMGDGSKLGASVTISYETQVEEYTIPAAGVDSPILSMDIYACNGVTTVEFPAADAIQSCELPQTITIDVAAILDMASSAVIGGTLTGGGQSYTVDNFGKIYVTVSSPVQIDLDCSGFAPGRTITIDATGAHNN